MKETNKEIVEDFKEKQKEGIIPSPIFSFSRVPKNTRIELMKYAQDEWADDRGAALNYIWKFFKGECSSGHEEINAKLDFLAEEIKKLKESKKEQPKIKKSIDDFNKEYKEKMEEK